MVVKNQSAKSFEFKEQNEFGGYYKVIKNLFDFLFAFVGLIIMLPVILVFSCLIRMESPGPAFYLQERIGLNGKKFKVIKLRSMRNDAEKNGAKWAEKNDPRVTKVGLFIRKTRIDELPQFINVLKGDMSIVGPRPERLIFIKQFEREIPEFKNRTLVKPGLTGWAQVNGGYDVTPKEKLELDMYYIDRASLVLDLKIIVKTIKIVITGEGAR
ncbi:sugar transferase [Bacillus luti]|uniref:Sugar transferase n=2 Tax=Bacillus luti TaxID=2026191 RepID=A0A7V7SBY8_9BACI|nr:sugar transferase [Bacillus luti]